MNRYGEHGSSYAADSVRNQYGAYGSTSGSFSANNRYSLTPPVIVRVNTVIGYLTSNPSIYGGVALATVDANCVFYSSSPDTGAKLPEAPAYVSASDGTYVGSVRVSWGAALGATQYVVGYSESETAQPTFLGPISGNVLTIDGLPALATYIFGVAGINSAGQGPFTFDTGYSAAAPTKSVLLVTLTGSGSGYVTSAPYGILCGVHCSAEFASTQSVVLTAQPLQGSTFTGWVSGACSGLGTCSVQMDQNRDVTASFATFSPPPELGFRSYLPAALSR